METALQAADHRMGTIEYEKIQKETMRKYDRLAKKYSAIRWDGGEDLKLKAKLDSLNAEMTKLYEDYKAGRAVSRIVSQPQAVRFAFVLPRWN